jgi:hypothetical protein
VDGTQLRAVDQLALVPRGGSQVDRVPRSYDEDEDSAPMVYREADDDRASA